MIFMMRSTWANRRWMEDAELLAELAADEYLRAVRPMIHDLPDPNWVTHPQVHANFERLHELGLRFEALTRTEHLPALDAALAAVPELPAVINHLSKPTYRPDADPRRRGFQLLVKAVHRWAIGRRRPVRPGVERPPAPPLVRYAVRGHPNLVADVVTGHGATPGEGMGRRQHHHPRLVGQLHGAQTIELDRSANDPGVHLAVEDRPQLVGVVEVDQLNGMAGGTTVKGSDQVGSELACTHRDEPEP
ncbi:MAG: hypothetical protein L0I76_01770 [Pseudonocardia sp.]|nr:hypothetical protein [Pseudonocardia sp.]